MPVVAALAVLSVVMVAFQPAGFKPVYAPAADKVGSAELVTVNVEVLVIVFVEVISR